MPEEKSANCWSSLYVDWLSMIKLYTIPIIIVFAVSGIALDLFAIVKN